MTDARCDVELNTRKGKALGRLKQFGRIVVGHQASVIGYEGVRAATSAVQGASVGP